MKHHFLLFLLFACSDASGARWMFLESDQVRGQDRLCVYSDALGAHAVTVPRWQACAPYVELDE